MPVSGLASISESTFHIPILRPWAEVEEQQELLPLRSRWRMLRTLPRTLPADAFTKFSSAGASNIVPPNAIAPTGPATAAATAAAAFVEVPSMGAFCGGGVDTAGAFTRQILFRPVDPAAISSISSGATLSCTTVGIVATSPLTSKRYRSDLQWMKDGSVSSRH